MILHSNYLSGLFDCITWVQVSQWRGGGGGGGGGGGRVL